MRRALKNLVGVIGGESLLRNGLYNVVGQTLRGAASLVAIPFLIRFLGIREYGVWSLAYAVLAVLAMSEAGISVAAAVFLSKDLAKRDFAEFGRTLTIILIGAVLVSVVLGLLLWFAGPLIVRSLPGFEVADRVHAGRALQIASLAVSILVLQRTLVGVEQAFDRYATTNVLELVQSLVTNVGLVVVAWSGGRTIALMKWQVFAFALLLAAHCCVVFLLLHRKGLSFDWSAEKARRMLRYSVATWTATLGSAAFSQFDRLIVGGVLGPSVLGVYAVITNITSKINSFSATAVQPLVPSLSRDASLSGAEDRIRQATRLNALIAIGAGSFLYVLADWIMRMLAPGATARQDIVGLQIAVVIYVLYSLNAPGHYILFSIGEARINAVVTVSSGIISLALIFAGARYFGLLGAVVGNAGYLGTLFLVALALKKLGIELRRYVAWLASPLLSLLAALVVGLFLENHLWWRVGFVALQCAVLSLFFFRTRTASGWVRFDDGRVPES